MGKEKKEIGKLLELLNEYSKNIGYFNEEDLQGQTKARILSKEFGWIEWLVEHNKLLHPDFVLHQKLFYGDSIPEHNFYLMMLSIADNPIAELNKMLRP